MDQIRISATNLGSLALETFCPRCYWVKLHCHHKMPYSIFPGIFNSIDAYTKKVVDSYFDRQGQLPGWLSQLGDVESYIKPPHYSRFNVDHDETGTLLTGSPDAVFRYRDGAHTIVDFKTAKFTGTQDELFPKYEAQLNAYAYIGERCGLSPTSSLYLIYMEPSTDVNTASSEEAVTSDGFTMWFIGKVLEVRLEPDEIIPPLLARTREIYEMDTCPEGARGCKDCDMLSHLLTVVADTPLSV